MKKGIAILMALIMALTAMGGSLAEGGKSDTIWDTVGEILSIAADEAGAWLDGKADEAVKWIEAHWDEVSAWLGQAWDDSVAWGSKIWGDVSKITSEYFAGASEAVKTWLGESLVFVSKKADETWAWLQQELPVLQEKSEELYRQLLDAIPLEGDTAGEKLGSAVDALLVKFGLTDTEVGKVWETLRTYSEEKKISVWMTGAIVLPFLIRLEVSREIAGEEKIPASVIAQYIIGLLDELHITTQEEAAECLHQLQETVITIDRELNPTDGVKE